MIATVVTIITIVTIIAVKEDIPESSATSKRPLSPSSSHQFSMPEKRALSFSHSLAHGSSLSPFSDLLIHDESIAFEGDLSLLLEKRLTVLAPLFGAIYSFRAASTFCTALGHALIATLCTKHSARTDVV